MTTTQIREGFQTENLYSSCNLHRVILTKCSFFSLSFNPFTDWLSSFFLSVFDHEWLQPKPPLQQNLPPPRPPTAKPKDPDSYDFKDEQVAKDYRYTFWTHPEPIMQDLCFVICHKLSSTGNFHCTKRFQKPLTSRKSLIVSSFSRIQISSWNQNKVC